MYTPYIEERCKQCPFAGAVTKPILGLNLRYIDCQRDNEDAKERWINSNKDEDLLLHIRQRGEFLHCMYFYFDFPEMADSGDLVDTKRNQ
jgi:hypothetical protein